MPSLPDTAVIIFLGLLIFGPKGLAQIARQVGKLMGEFRRASNEFRMQMEDELRMSEQAERQKQIAAMEAAAPRGACATARAELGRGPGSCASSGAAADRDLRRDEHHASGNGPAGAKVFCALFCVALFSDRCGAEGRCSRRAPKRRPFRGRTTPHALHEPHGRSSPGRRRRGVAAWLT
jgi:TatA/E family protein of Tat protein translocase